MKRRTVIAALLLVISAIALSFLGCTAVVRVPPPAERVEVYGSPPHPEAVWIAGYWSYRGGTWVWVPGHWERPPRPHAVWVPGRWEPREGGWVWIKGHWEYR